MPGPTATYDTRSSGPAAADSAQSHSEESTGTNQASTATISCIRGVAAEMYEASLTLLTANDINPAEIAC